MGINITDLSVTQKGFRSLWQMPNMVKFVSTGGIFDTNSINAFSNGKDLRLVNIVCFEDGRMFIHDGHHRVAAIYLGGRDVLLEKEFYITHWRYEDYVAINFDKRWITPFDPRFEVRVSDYTEFKDEVWDRYSTDGETLTENYIREHKTAYAMPRRARCIRDMLRDL